MKGSIKFINDRSEIKSKAIVAFFIFLSSLLATMTFILIQSAYFSMEEGMVRSQTPHFLQMHKGPMDKVKLDDFYKANSDLIDKWQLVEYVGFPNEGPLKDYNQENGIVSDDLSFDFLLDSKNRVIKVNRGDVYIPNMYKDIFKIGDKIRILSKDFTVKGILRDLQMGSSLSSSKRFLLNKEDFEEIKARGQMEYLIEYRLKNEKDVAKVQEAYTKSSEFLNGPQITYGLFKIMNSITSGINILLTLLSSLIALIISLLALKITIGVRLQEDLKSIGVLKAIGVKDRDFSKLYRGKYIKLILPSIVVGIVVAYFTRDLYLKEIYEEFGIPSRDLMIFLMSFLVSIVLFIIIYIRLRGIMGKIRKFDPLKVLKGTYTLDGRPSFIRLNKGLRGRILFSLNNILSSWTLYLPSIILISLAITMTTIPSALLDSINNSSFSRYLGIGDGDYRLDLEAFKGFDKKDLEEILSKDDRLAKYSLYSSALVSISSKESVLVPGEEGDHSIYPVFYINGREPKEKEVALSQLLAEELGINIDDRVKVKVSGKEEDLIVAGIYSDVTSGGKTLKLFKSQFNEDTKGYTGYINLKDRALSEEFIKDIKERIPQVKIRSNKDFMEETLRDVIKTMKKSYIFTLVASILILVSISYLILSLILEREKGEISLLRSLGFRGTFIAGDYFLRNIIIAILGIIISIILLYTLGNRLISFLFSLLGSSSFKIRGNFGPGLIRSISLLAISILAVTSLTLQRVKKGNFDIRDIGGK